MAGIMQMAATNLAPSIPTPTVYLDAMDYSGSGTTWTAEFGSNATLVNTPTFVTPSPTYFSFAPASLEEATLPALSSLNSWTVEAWFRVTSTLTGQVTSVICDQYNGSSALNFSMGTNNAPSDYKMRIGFFNGAWHNTSGFDPTLNTWYHMVGTYDGTTMKEYVNGALTSSTSGLGTSSSGGVGLRIARRWDSSATSTNYFPGDVGLTRIWNSALSAAQIQVLYNQNLARFSLTPTITTFTATGSTSWTAPVGVSTVQYLVVAGGGGGANGYDNAGGGGGGAGMVLTGYLSVVRDQSYTVTVGDGGAGGANTRTNNPGSVGSNSIFDTITALGGGGGLGSRTGGTAGAAQVSNTTAPTGGAGSGGGFGGKGGGGATGAGSDNSGTTGGAGGAGLASSITGSSVTYGVGGAGANSGTQNGGAAGTANRGNGGQAGGATSGSSVGAGAGGSGIVVVSYGS